ncbi:Antibiotic biosynthesis monooxygenase [Rubellimicrobium mesophilum DSM 19309]|uniref:Antibiotic biosynthesis monooxygenase n=1 Tax=Rubellimicrobium mesophilum DSM 19309 TaxID=442562 RepID=A0A017HQC3_9RHOB|nr:antibiotic biosynthesis monooxygenase family protein [Rubellimicrobium mesophilum]EYD76536.1 Antibiotic biosynthesis monooxygenase [Rubellimicrobium mesophilum DSM 19309]
MILETAELTIAPGHEAAFEAAVREAVPLFLASPGCRGVRLHRVVEVPGLYRLLVDWASLEDHTVGFRGSEAFTQWRALVSPHFAAPPVVTHSEEVLSSGAG